MLKTIRYLIIALIGLTVVGAETFANNNVQAPQDNCPNFIQMLPAGMDVVYAPRISQGIVQNAPVSDDVMNNLHTFIMSQLQDEIATEALFGSTPPNESIIYVQSPTPLELTGNYTCLTNTYTFVFREAKLFNQTGWVLEAVTLPEIPLTDSIIEHFTTQLLEPLETAPENNGQIGYVPQANFDDLNYQPEQQNPNGVLMPDLTPVLSRSTFYFWELQDITPFDAPDGVASPDIPLVYCDEYTAPSYLSVGMQAELAGYSYGRFPQSGDLEDGSNDNWLNLGGQYNTAYSAQFHAEMLQTPLHQQPLSDNINANVETLFAPPVYPLYADILAGPYCGQEDIVDNHPCPDNGVCEYTEPVNDQYSVWWQIEVEVHGQSYIGWYPENVTRYAWWLYETDGVFDQAATAYLLVPYGQAMTVADECADLPTSRFNAGLDVQPENSALNVRDSANGNVIGRAEIGTGMTLVGEPECEDGIRWREVVFHTGTIGRGWIAENDDTVFFIATYVPPVVTEEPTPIPAEPSDPTGSSSVPSTQPEPQPTTPPSTAPERPTAIPGTGSTGDPCTAADPCAPTGDPVGSGGTGDTRCNPARGAGC